MGMTGEYRSVADDVLAALLENPDAIHGALDFGIERVPGPGGFPLGSEIKNLLQSVPEEKKTAIEAQLARYARDFAEAAKGTPVEAMMTLGSESRSAGTSFLRARDLAEEHFDDPLSIDKAWHGLHFLLTGTSGEAPPPLGNVVLGGTEVGEDLGYGSARYLSPSEVRLVADALQSIDVNALKPGFLPAEMDTQRVYPGGWQEPEMLDWLLEALASVSSYFASAADRNRAMILSIV